MAAILPAQAIGIFGHSFITDTESSFSETFSRYCNLLVPAHSLILFEIYRQLFLREVHKRRIEFSPTQLHQKAYSNTNSCLNNGKFVHHIFPGFGNINCLCKVIANSQRKKYKQKKQMLFTWFFLKWYK